MPRIAACLCAIFILASTAGAQSYTVIDLGVLSGDVSSEGRAISPGGEVAGDVENNLQGFVWSPTRGMIGLPRLNGGRYSAAVGINPSGLITGYATYNEIENTHAVLWTKAGVQDLGTLPGGTESWAAAINASGQVAGGSDSATTAPNAFLWSKDRGMQALGVLPNGYYSEAFGVNNLGQVVGMSNTTRGNWHAFTWSKATRIKDLGTLDSGRSTSATANGVNDLGQIVGTSSCGASCVHAVLWTSSGMRDLGTLPDSSSSGGIAINNKGQVVGQSGHAFVWSQTNGMQDLNTLIDPASGWTLLWAFAINDAGQITGSGLIDGESHAFLLTPQ